MSTGRRKDRDRVETRAREVLAHVPEWIWDGDSLPVPVEGIVSDAFGLLIREVDDMTAAPGLEGERSTNVSGLLLTDRGEIWVNAAEARQWAGRKRFTICHELGHYVIHREVVQPTVFCRKVEEGDEVESVPGGSPDLEREADLFAAALLMPSHLVVDRFEAIGPDLAALREAFGSSEKAMRHRLATVVGWTG